MALKKHEYITANFMSQAKEFYVRRCTAVLEVKSAVCFNYDS